MRRFLVVLAGSALLAGCASGTPVAAPTPAWPTPVQAPTQAPAPTWVRYAQPQEWQFLTACAQAKPGSTEPECFCVLRGLELQYTQGEYYELFLQVGHETPQARAALAAIGTSCGL